MNEYVTVLKTCYPIRIDLEGCLIDWFGLYECLCLCFGTTAELTNHGLVFCVQDKKEENDHRPL